MSEHGQKLAPPTESGNGPRASLASSFLTLVGDRVVLTDNLRVFTPSRPLACPGLDHARLLMGSPSDRIRQRALSHEGLDDV